jgi:phenylacetate-coenzyme A ligase PaaK-like adenylate-forming protein
LFDLENIIDVAPFSLSREEKNELYLDGLSSLTVRHYDHCPQYRKILDTMAFDPRNVGEIAEFPFIPVRLFKEYDLLSVPREDIVKTMTSSGTTGQRVSKIFLDRTTSAYQTKVLAKIVSSFTGKKRLPMLVIDSSSVLKDRMLFSARGAGILGFSMLGYDLTYALDEHMKINLDQITIFLEKHKDESILLFGFTFMIWEHFYKELKKANIRLPIDNGVLIHGGGWKKLASEAVDNQTFKNSISQFTGINKNYNYYGMVEQTGSIFMECESGLLHASIFSDVIIRDYKDFRSLGVGETGLIQLLSLLPHSYPGHSILSEDLGELLGEDNCECGRKGKYFRIHGRIKNAEIRGCSDTYETK